MRKMRLNKDFKSKLRNKEKSNIKRNEKTEKIEINDEENSNIKEKLEEQILIQLNKLNFILTRNKMLDLIELVGNPKKLLIRNFTSGIIRGIGIGIGVSLITAIIIYLIQEIIKLNIPIISQYIADVLEIVQQNR